MSRKKNKRKKAKKIEDETFKLSDIVKKVEVSDSNLTPYTERFVRFYKLYRSYIPKDQWPTKSQIFNPHVFSIIETQTAKHMSTKPIGTWKPANDDDDENADGIGDPKKLQMAFEDWYRKEHAVFTSQDMFKKTLMYGGGSAQVYWNFKKGFKLGEVFIKKNCPSIRVLRLEDKMFGFDPETDSFDDCKWAFIRYPISKKELEDIKESPTSTLYKNIDKAINSFSSDDTYDDEGMMQDRKDVIGAKNINDETIKKAECIYLENYETGDCITVIGKKHIIMDRKNPYLSEKSLILTSNVRIPSETIGMSEVEPIESLIHGANLFRNQRADNIEGILKPQWISTLDGEVDDDELADEDTLIIHAKDINSVSPVKKENVTGTAYKEDEAIKNDIYSATSITPFSMGNDNDVAGDRSGKAIGKLQDAANARIKNKMMNFEISYIKEVAEKWQRLVAQYQTEDIIIDDNGKDVVITPEDLGHSEDGSFGEWEFYVESGSTQHVDEGQSREDYIAWQDKMVELSKLKQDAEMGPQEQEGMMPGMMPPQPEQILDYDKMAEKLSEKFGQKDWREVWIMEDEEELMQPEEEEMLPSVEDEQVMQEEMGGQMIGGMEEMLPGIDDMPQMAQHSMEQPQQSEMLPSIDEMPQQMPQEQQEMLPSAEAPQDMLPPVEKKGLMDKLKGLFKKKGNKEMLPPVN